MGAYILIFGMALINGFYTICHKNYTNDNINVKNSLNIYLLLAHPMAALYFLIMAGGYVPLNLPSFVFSFVYAWVCMASILFTLLAYDKINLIYISVFSGAGAMVIPLVYDWFCGVEFSVYKYIALMLRIAAVLIPLVCNKSKNRGLIICIILFFVGGIAGIIPKIYGAWDGVVSDESFCFWTNIIIVPITFVLIFSQVQSAKDSEGSPKVKGKLSVLRDDMKKIKLSGYVFILVATLASNINSLAAIEIMRLVSPTIYAILFSSFKMLVTAAISVFIYKEGISKQSVISLILSIGAVVLGVL